MAYLTEQAISALNQYLGISDAQKKYIADTKKRGFVIKLDNDEEVVIFVYPLVHKQDNTKNYFDTRDKSLSCSFFISTCTVDLTCRI